MSVKLIEIRQMAQCGHIAIEAEARDDTYAGGSSQRVSADVLASVNIANVNFDRW